MQDDFSDLAIGLYAGLLDHGGLMPALERVAGAVGASAVSRHLVRHEAGMARAELAEARGGVADPAREAYRRHWMRLDPWTPAMASLPPGVHDMAAHVPPETRRASAVWQEWGRRHEASFHALVVPIAEGEALLFKRREGEPAFGARERGVLEALLPHLRRAGGAAPRLAPALAALPGQEGLLASGFEALPDGIAIHDGGGRMIHANAALRHMAALADGFRLGPEGIEPVQAAGRQALRRAILAALAAAEGRLGLLATAGSFALARPSGAAPWLGRALPLRGRDRAGHGALLLLGDAARPRKPSAALLGALFGLTPAEASLAAGLAAGRTLAEHAGRRRIGLETARSQLAAIRRKTGCRRQSEIVALLARLPG
jgi:DNA-binding CsgD family transcriptional regulator/PAS domain-containing protein